MSATDAVSAPEPGPAPSGQGRPLERRSLQPELMDDPRLDPVELDRALRGLRRLNWISRAAGSLWAYIRPLAASSPRPLRVIDIATGSGDVPISLARLARRSGVELELHACDLREEMLGVTRERARQAGVQIRTFRFDAMQDSLRGAAAGHFDVAITSLFCHHLPAAAIVRLLAEMSRAASVVLVSDLLRTRASLVLTWLGSRALTRSRIVHVDAMLSIGAGFTLAEFHSLARDAGLQIVQLCPTPPARFVMAARSGHSHV